MSVLLRLLALAEASEVKKDTMVLVIEEADRLYGDNKIPELYEHLINYKVRLISSLDVLTEL